MEYQHLTDSAEERGRGMEKSAESLFFNGLLIARKSAEERHNSSPLPSSMKPRRRDFGPSSLTTMRPWSKSRFMA